MPTRLQILFLFLFFITSKIYAQWIPKNGNSTTNNLSFVTINETIGITLAGGNKIIKSTNNGETWSTIHNNSSNSFEFKSGVALTNTNYIVVGSTIGGYGRIFRTINSGGTWVTASNTLYEFLDIANNGTALVAVGKHGLISSSIDGGATWTSQPSGVTIDLLTVEWDPLQGKWIIGGENKRLESSSNAPTSWTITTTNYKIKELNFRNNQLIETRYFSSGDTTKFVLYDNIGNIINSISYYDYYFVKMTKANDNRLIGVGEHNFYEMNLQNNELGIGIDSLYNPSSFLPNSQTINDLDICSDFALAVGVNGAICKYNLQDTLNNYAPAQFYFASPFSTCPGASFAAIPISSQGETYEWFIEDSLISSNDTLFWTWPTIEYYDVKLIVTTNGIQTMSNQNIHVYNGFYFPALTLTVDTTKCYGEKTTVNLHSTSYFSSGFMYEFVENGAIVASGNIPSTGYFQNFLSNNLTQSGVLEFNIYNTGVCGTIYQSYPINMIVGPNLDTFNLVQTDIGICSDGDSVHFSLNNLVSGASFELKSTEFYDGTFLNPQIFDTIIGTGPNTLDLAYPSEMFYFSQLNSQNSFVDNDVTIYINAKANYQGCTATLTDTIVHFDITNPNANFSISDQSILVNDTIEIVNLQITDSTFWSITPLNGNFSSLQSSTPILSPNLPGEYSIQVINKTRFNCIDSTSKKQVVGDLLTNNTLENTCYTAVLPSMCVLGSLLDTDNNLIEFGYCSRDVPNWTSFAIRKIDSSGILLWEKPLEMDPYMLGGTHILTAVDIDENDNIYAAIRLKNDGNVLNDLNFESIHLSNNYNTGFIIKWSPQGQEIAKYETLLEVSDIEIEQNQIYVIGIGGIIHLDSNLNLMHSDPFTGYIYTDNQYNYGSGDPNALNEWRWKPRFPKMTSLPNGKIIVLSDVFVYTTYLTISPGVTIIPNPNNLSSNSFSHVVFAAEYIPGQGLLNAKKIFELPIETSSTPGSLDDKMGIIASFISDEDNNMYILTDAKSYRNMTYFDSIITEDNDLYNKSFIVKINSQFESEWIVQSNIHNGTLNYSLGANQLYLTGNLKHNFYLGKSNDFKVIEGVNGNNFINDEPFYGVISKSGHLISGKTFGVSGAINRNKVKSSVSNCGSLFVSQENNPLEWSAIPYTSGIPNLQLEINNNIYSTDSNFVFKISEFNCANNCSFICLRSSQIVNTCDSDINIKIPVYENYNLDTIQYEVLENNTIVNSGYAHIINKQVVLPNTFTNNQSIILHGTIGSNLIDTFQIQKALNPNPFDSFYNVECNDQLSLQLNSANYSNVTWTNSTGSYSNNTMIYNLNDFIIGDTVSYEVNFTGSTGCVFNDAINIIYCTDLSIQENFDSEITVYPNPVVGNLNIHFDHPIEGNGIVVIYDIQGRIILNSILNLNLDNDLNIEFLSKGSYFLKLTINNFEKEYLVQFTKQ